ncbi:FG-GAP repeat protein [Anaeromyxobacter terrae]|uniref:FG-GAP repeat protein n=1 Tax=Anaeromyxobacter terrae TaxID=2925406 RepID=UPI001F584EA1|nr:FG-GAP repeat protein [Anaeromyxobacter sp. SG22]
MTPSDLDAYDLFGCALSMSASGARLVAGAYQGGGAADPGAVYVYDAAGGGWSVARLVAADGVDGDAFGDSVAVSSDGSTIVGGAPLADVGANAHQGFVLVFR